MRLQAVTQSAAGAARGTWSMTARAGFAPLAAQGWLWGRTVRKPMLWMASVGWQ
jgi:hypothetical protein